VAAAGLIFRRRSGDAVKLRIPRSPFPAAQSEQGDCPLTTTPGPRQRGRTLMFVFTARLATDAIG
jgi:hypothetical protein